MSRTVLNFGGSSEGIYATWASDSTPRLSRT